MNGWFVRQFQAIEATPTCKAAVSYFIMDGIQHPHAKRMNKEGEKKQYPETTIIIEGLDTKYINKKQTNVNLRTATKHETQGKAGGQGIPFTWPFVTSIGQGQPTSVTSPDAPAPISVQSWLP